MIAKSIITTILKAGCDYIINHLTTKNEQKPSISNTSNNNETILGSSESNKEKISTKDNIPLNH
jgi:hypothetical protein